MVKRTDTLTDTRQQETDRPLAIRPAKLQLLQEILHLCACAYLSIYLLSIPLGLSREKNWREQLFLGLVQIEINLVALLSFCTKP